jgi:hypothetical protein
MLTIILLTFLGTTVFYALIAYLAARRIARRLKGDDVATQAFSQYILIPLLGGHRDEKDEEPAQRRAPGKIVPRDASPSSDDDSLFPVSCSAKKKPAM